MDPRLFYRKNENILRILAYHADKRILGGNQYFNKCTVNKLKKNFMSVGTELKQDPVLALSSIKTHELI